MVETDDQWLWDKQAKSERTDQFLVDSTSSDVTVIHNYRNGMGTQPNNFPILTTTFVGRERELEEIGTVYGSSRLLTLTGVGGTGKTRLALRHAADQIALYTDGAWLVELAPLSEPNNVPSALADVFGVSEEPGIELATSLIDYLRNKRMLLVIDNCEHLLKGVSSIVARILKNCPGVRILATSREALRSDLETTYLVPSLHVPQSDELHEITQSAAVKLFVDRATSVSPSFALTLENSEAVAAICRRLEGIPLAVELAAARMKTMEAHELLLRLNAQYQVLVVREDYQPYRHHSLRALIDWSYDLLDESEQTVIQSLSVFRGGWNAEYVTKICTTGGIDEVDVPDLLTSLVERSLLTHYDGRYGMLETIRRYASDRLDDSGEANAVRERHARLFVEFCVEAHKHNRTPDYAAWVMKFKEEHENIRTALAFLCSDQEYTNDALNLVAAAWCFWGTLTHLTEGRQWCDAAIRNAQGRAAFAVLGQALVGSATLARLQADFAAASLHAQEAIELLRKCGDRRGLASALDVLGNVKTAKGEKQEAREIYSEALAIRREIDDKSGIGTSLNALGVMAIEASELQDAKLLFEECRSIFNDLGDEIYYALATKNLGTIYEIQGDYDESLSLFEKSIAIYELAGDQHRAYAAKSHTATIHMQRGDIDTAERWFLECYDFHSEIGDKRGQADLLGDLALIDIWRRNYADARAKAEESLINRRSMGDQWGIAYSLQYLGIARLLLGEIEASCSALSEALTLRESLSDKRGTNHSRLWLGNALLSNGEIESAKEYFVAALSAFREIGDKAGLVQTVEALGRAAVFSCPGCTVRLLSYGTARRKELGSAYMSHEAEWNELALEHAKEEISDEFFEESWHEGAEMTLDEAVKYATR